MCLSKNIRKKFRHKSKKPNENTKHMNFRLEFNDKTIEKKYRKSLLGYQQNYFRNYQICSFIVVFIGWIMDPVGGDQKGIPLISNVINVGLNVVVAIYFYYKRNFSYPDYAILIFQMYLVIGYIETKYDVIKTKYTVTSFITTTLFIETVMLGSMISRCSWKINFLTSFVLNIYLSYRYTNYDEEMSSKGLPTTAHLLNFLFITICSYFNEKYDRNIFYKRYKDEQSLSRFEQILKEVLPASIIIYKKNKVTFYNDEAVKMLNINDNNEIEKQLKMITISSEKHKGKSFNPNEKLENEKNHFVNIDKHENSVIEYFSQFMNSNFNRDFINLTGVFLENEKILKTEKRNSQSLCTFLDIKIGRISWKGKDAVMAIMVEDFATQKLLDMQEQAKYKDKLLATVSHDLRTPLNGVIGILDLALEGMLDRNLRKSLQLAFRSSNLLLFMINDILDFSQISNGSLSLNPVSFSIEDMINDTIKLLKFQAKRKGLAFMIDNKLTKESKINFISDPNRIKQILLNLLGNALKFTQKGFIKLTIEEIREVSTEKATAFTIPLNKNSNIENPAIKFSVEDTGCGIKKENIPKLFKLFGMLKNEESSKYNQNGVGLGLAISQQLVRILNCNREGAIINVDSEYGKGSLFSFLIYPFILTPSEFNLNSQNLPENQLSKLGEFYFPDDSCNMLMESCEYSRNINEVKIKSNFEIFRKVNLIKRVLLVDDDQINILVLTKIFEKFNDCEFFTAFNGKEAIEIVREKAKNNYFFNIIFMDCNMPVLDGFEATKGIRHMIEMKEIPALAIIASTANVTQSDREYCYKSGMVDFISKPFTKSILREKIDLHCN